MLDTQALKSQNLDSLSRAELNAMIPQLLSHVDEPTRHIGEQRRQLDSAAQAIKWRDAKIEKITLQLAQLKSWRYGAKSERMSTEQRELFAESLAADQADLEAQLAALQAAANPTPASTPATSQPAEKRKPKREPLPEHLPRVDSRVEPENTPCECGQAMQRVGEDISERLDIIPAQFFGLAGRVGPQGQPFVRHKASSGRFVFTLSSGKFEASGPASAASSWCRSRLPCRSSRAACPPRACRPTP